MQTNEIKQILESYFSKTNQDGYIEKKRTAPGTYHIGTLTGNRLNSGTLRSQIIVFETSSLWSSCNESAKKSLHNDQRAFVQVGDDIWDVYQGGGLEYENIPPIKIISKQPDLKELLKKQIIELQTTAKNTKNNTVLQNKHLQVIYFGAPGTGKSHRIKELTEGCENVIRTTFHPDSDYSTFVGAYKPTMKENVITKNGVETKEEQIVYRFVPQAFTKAYITAWNTVEDVYLVIEEINRGNCAQIFGDLFQLLDRKDGLSEYPVDADSDLADHIRKGLEDSPRTDFPEGVKEGMKLRLPSNLYIWATMNTSDQSLFPIDSAFKRRWEWKYMKIKDHPEKDYKIKLSDKTYGWYTFIEKINDIIASMTSSADKQLGYFFCKADNEGNIDAETFVAKVIFYLWNDVFKDYGFEDTSLFRYKDEKDDQEKDLAFPDFYDKEGEKVNETRLKGFLESVMNWKKKSEENG